MKFSNHTNEKKIKAIIADDEVLARINIREAVRTCCDWSIVSEVSSAEELYGVLEKVMPDVIFLDIKMPGEKGTDVAKKLMKSHPRIHIIFVTAYDHYAIQAFELYAMDYLLKPFNNDRFSKAVDRVEQYVFHEKTDLSLRKWQQKQLGTDQKLDKIIIRSIGSIRIIAVTEVYWFAASGNYVEVHHEDGMHLHRIQLKFLESQIDASVFCRVHRSAIVKIAEIKEFKTIEDNRYMVILSNGESVKVSPTYKEKLMSLLGIE